MKKFLILGLALVAAAAIADELAVGAAAPRFSLTNATDWKSYTFSPGNGKTSVVVFTCNSCPYSKAYRGYVDDSAKGDEREHTGLSDALDALLANKEVRRTSTKAFGCTIKWKS